ncbi:DUF2398 family protein [Streptomyces sp. ID38640]|uniref:DUF2398 family protein n=1 Tax=Streptomyces sp. ID38640 TaxID=1265399 RepID=UPI00140EA0AC|nr:DUF2398 family protein [Streptomyces sp. ID38640]QIK04715.1 DUF2398 family protein [Streptomyces sp. ID38640]QIK10880.1 DUF2398 family protein [Streptomyces sp. ID38640]QIK10931.1 DUF2398 family protein [Streptomyces sp. ID38640]
MNDDLMLDADLRESARLLIANTRLTAEGDPEHYAAALQGHRVLAEFFRRELSWPLETHEAAGLIRLHKRRADVPGDRGPRLVRDRQPLADSLVLILICLACEQLWRRPRMSVRELMQAIAQVCAKDAGEGLLPRFPVVASEGVSKKEARHNRQSLAEALKILLAEGTITVDADLDRALAEEDGDLVVTASRDRLAARFSSLSPTLLKLDDLRPEEHTTALSTDFLLDHTAEKADDAPTVEQRRLAAVRRLIDDPATDPRDDAADAAGTTAYLHTLTGRERALNVTAALGLTATVRRDWWQVTDPSGQASGIDFPNGRRTERQAALALLEALPSRPEAVPLTLADITDLFAQARARQPRWAASYDRLSTLARAAAAELASAGLLTPDPDQPDRWHPTPGVHLWRLRVHQPAPPPAAPSPPPAAAPLPNPRPPADDAGSTAESAPARTTRHGGDQ